MAIWLYDMANQKNLGHCGMKKQAGELSDITVVRKTSLKRVD